MTTALKLATAVALVLASIAAALPRSLQAIVDRVASGRYQARPARIFGFDEIRAAHALMEADQANGKLVVRV